MKNHFKRNLIAIITVCLVLAYSIVPSVHIPDNAYSAEEKTVQPRFVQDNERNS